MNLILSLLLSSLIINLLQTAYILLLKQENKQGMKLLTGTLAEKDRLRTIIKQKIYQN